MNAGQKGEMRALKLALALYVVVFALKLAAFFVTGVIVLLAEALHTLSDIFVSGFLLASLVWSRKAADAEHAYGHGRAQNVAALVAATLFISFTSLKLYEEAVPRLFAAESTTYQSLPVALGTILVSMLIAAAPLHKLAQQREKGAAAKAQLRELLNDELGLLAALLGTLAIAFGQPIGDPIAAVVVATIIAAGAVGLFLENASFLLGRSPDPAFVERIRNVASSVPGVLGVHDLRAEYIGPDTIRTGMHIFVRRGIAVEEGDQIAHEVRDRVHEATGCQYCVIHVDPAERPEPAERSRGEGNG